jgi:ferredoxin-NADP reductase
VRLGVQINGVRHWRAYSITSDPGHPAGEVSVTVQRVEGGVVSPYLTQRCEPGDRLVLGSVEGTFSLPDLIAPKLLMITGGCGITPVMSMLRELERRDELDDTVHVHASQTAEGFIFGDMLRALADADNGYGLIERHSTTDGRLRPDDLESLIPDWSERMTYLSGPAAMMSEFRAHWARHGDPSLLITEDFQPVIGGRTDAPIGSGGTVSFRVSGLDVTAEPGQSILVAGEAAGARLPHGCRMGICHSCIGRLREGQVRDLRTGEVHGEPGQAVRTCVNGPVGDIAIEL